MPERDLSRDLNFVRENRESLLQNHRNKFILVHEGELVGSYDTYNQAAEEGVRLYGVEGNFLVYHLVEQEPVNFIMEAVL